jgi:hypothetical protein
VPDNVSGQRCYRRTFTLSSSLKFSIQTLSSLRTEQVRVPARAQDEDECVQLPVLTRKFFWPR